MAGFFLGAEIPDEKWNDWHWQLAHRIQDVETLARALPLFPGERAGIEACLGRFRMAISPYYASLINIADPADPIRRQAVPSGLETRLLAADMADPLGEDADSPVPALIHRYPDRVLLLSTHQCAMYCRHCTRRRLVGEEDRVISAEELNGAVDYIARHPEVRDVLISGGDPLTLSDDRLEEILARVRAIKHVEVVRIGSRVPVVLPMRITDSLCTMLKRYHPLWLNTHFNHPNELTPASIAACERLADAGIPVGNQSVLLRGVNDDAETMKRLLTGLVKARVRPYYLYQCDMSQGIGHFRTRVETGIEIMQSLIGNISGFAVPRFVIDAPGGGGKIPVTPQYVLSMDNEKVLLRNYEGKLYTYPQPQDL